MQKTSSKEFDKVEVITSVQRRRRWTTAEKLQMVEESELPGMSVSYVARKYGVSSSLLFTWRRLAREGRLSAIRAGEEVIPASEARQLQARIRELERLLGRKTMNEHHPHKGLKMRSPREFIRFYFHENGCPVL